MIFIVIIFLLLIYFNPYVDIFKDYRNKYHIIIWYGRKDRKHIDLLRNE